jgi:hypothetical protein
VAVRNSHRNAGIGRNAAGDFASVAVVVLQSEVLKNMNAGSWTDRGILGTVEKKAREIAFNADTWVPDEADIDLGFVPNDLVCQEVLGK